MKAKDSIKAVTTPLVGAAMRRIAQRRPGHSRLVYDRVTRTVRIQGQHGEDKGDSGLGLHDE